MLERPFPIPVRMVLNRDPHGEMDMWEVKDANGKRIDAFSLMDKATACWVVSAVNAFGLEVKEDKA